MKIKTTFITNSSSASFTIMKHHLSDLQIKLIYEHIEVGFLVSNDGRYNGRHVHFINDPQFRRSYSYDEWSISEDEETISGYTTMDNFDMMWFLTEVLQIKQEHIDYDHP